jgi:hypothetical protein
MLCHYFTPVVTPVRVRVLANDLNPQDNKLATVAKTPIRPTEQRFTTQATASSPTRQRAHLVAIVFSQ